MTALSRIAISNTIFRNYVAATAQAQELVALAEEKGSPYWKVIGMMIRGSVLALTGRASEAIGVVTSAVLPGHISEHTGRPSPSSSTARKVSPSLIGQSLLLNTRGGDELAFAKLVFWRNQRKAHTFAFRHDQSR